jgi:hypothetical protein
LSPADDSLSCFSCPFGRGAKAKKVVGGVRESAESRARPEAIARYGGSRAIERGDTEWTGARPDPVLLAGRSALG